MPSPKAIAALERLLRAMPRNVDLIELSEELKAEWAAPRVTTPMVTAESQGAPASPDVVTQTVAPKRDRAKYMRDYRASSKSKVE